MQLTPQMVARLRAQFPALQRQQDGQPCVYFDGPAGTQVPQRVIDAIGWYLANCNANLDGRFATSQESGRSTHAAHEAVADFLGAEDPTTVSFGANMTTITLAVSRALARHWHPGDEIVLARTEHDANFTPWVLAAADAGAHVRYVDVDPTDCTLRVDQYRDALGPKTRLVAVGCASNATGTVNPVKQICAWAREAGAMTFLDAVHFAPHALVDVADWDCDFLVCSAYKFFGPHVGVLYGRRQLLEQIRPYKLRPSTDELPGRWMTGTQNHEGIAGVRAAIDYLADLGRELQTEGPTTRRQWLTTAMTEIRRYESSLVWRLIDRLAAIEGIRIWGITDPNRAVDRLPTVALTHSRFTSRQLAEGLGQRGIFTWHGNYYALPLTEAIGVEPEGMLRIGLFHYNTVDEVDRFVDTLTALVC